MLFRFYIFILLFFPTFIFAYEGEFDINRWSMIIQNIKDKAIYNNLGKQIITDTTKYAVFIPSVIKSDKNQSEFTTTLDYYLSKTISDNRIKYGKKQKIIYKNLLNKVYKKYGIQPNVILAFWALESDYGRKKTAHKLTDVFFTLMYNGRRQIFFENQILALMRICEKSKLDISKIYGSWAGAIGHFQFIPTTLELYGIDANKDNKIDIINNLSDAMFSAGNYLNKLNWNKKEKIIQEIDSPINIDLSLLDGKTKKTVSEWKTLGIKGLNNTIIKDSNQEVGLLVDMKNGYINRAFLTYPNFYRIKKWNNSNWYAIAISLLSDKLK